MCRRHYRGQEYCSDSCRRTARLQLHREANARHQGSKEGRRDHAERQRNYCANLRRNNKVTDGGREKVATRGLADRHGDPACPTDGQHAAGGRGQDHESVHLDDGGVTDGDTTTSDPRHRRADASRACTTWLRPSRICSAIATSGYRLLVRPTGACCVVCGRRADFILDDWDCDSFWALEQRLLHRASGGPRSPPAARSSDQRQDRWAMIVVSRIGPPETPPALALLAPSHPEARQRRISA